MDYADPLNILWLCYSVVQVQVISQPRKFMEPPDCLSQFKNLLHYEIWAHLFTRRNCVRFNPLLQLVHCNSQREKCLNYYIWLQAKGFWLSFLNNWQPNWFIYTLLFSSWVLLRAPKRHPAYVRGWVGSEDEFSSIYGGGILQGLGTWPIFGEPWAAFGCHGPCLPHKFGNCAPRLVVCLA